MKKSLLVSLIAICLCGFTFGQTIIKTFWWDDSSTKLYYATGNRVNMWTVSSNGHTPISDYSMPNNYSTYFANTDTCYLVYPKSFVYNNCPSVQFYGMDKPPYYKTTYSINYQGHITTSTSKYKKPCGVLHIPHYSILVTNDVPKYRTLTGIEERTFYNCDSLTKLIIPSTVRWIKSSFIYGCNMLDTIVFENTFNEDTIYPPRMDDYTFLTTHPITIVVPCNSYDTFYNYISSLETPQIAQINIIPDDICNCNAYALDTVLVYDTIKVNEIVYDTIVVYDTILTNIYHTHHIYDTTVVNDTLIHDVWNVYYDTNFVFVYDTILITYIDSVVITKYDTFYDTLYTTIYDTVIVFVQTNETYNDLKLYPVPTRDYVNVDYFGYLDYQLYDDRGKLLQSGSITTHDIVDLSNYTTGNYYFKARLDNGNIVTKKVVKVSM